MTPPLSDRRFEEQLGRFLADELPDRELDAFLALLEDPEHPERLDRLRALTSVQALLEEAPERGVARPLARSRPASRVWMLAAIVLLGLGLWWALTPPEPDTGLRGDDPAVATPDLEVHLAVESDGRRIPRAPSGIEVSSDARVHVVPSCGRTCEFVVFREHDGAPSRVSIDGRSTFDGDGGAPVPIGPIPLPGAGAHRLVVLAWAPSAAPTDPAVLLDVRALPPGVERVTRSVTVRAPQVPK